MFQLSQESIMTLPLLHILNTRNTKYSVSTVLPFNKNVKDDSQAIQNVFSGAGRLLNLSDRLMSSKYFSHCIELKEKNSQIKRQNKKTQPNKFT